MELTPISDVSGQASLVVGKVMLFVLKLRTDKHINGVEMRSLDSGIRKPEF